MRRGMLGAVALALATTVATAACTTGGRHQRTADNDPSASATSTTSTTISYAIPATIDAAYVEKVMRALDHLYGNAIRELVRSRAATDEFNKDLIALYTQREFEYFQQITSKALQRGLRDFSLRPNDPTTTVDRILSAEATCVIVAVKRDLSPTLSQAAPPTPQRYIALVPLQAARDPSHRNPTPWMLGLDGYSADSAAPANPCGTQ